jgi:hypothetical protein
VKVIIKIIVLKKIIRKELNKPILIRKIIFHYDFLC